MNIRPVNIPIDMSPFAIELDETTKGLVSGLSRDDQHTLLMNIIDAVETHPTVVDIVWSHELRIFQAKMAPDLRKQIEHLVFKMVQ